MANARNKSNFAPSIGATSSNTLRTAHFRKLKRAQQVQVLGFFARGKTAPVMAQIDEELPGERPLGAQLQDELVRAIEQRLKREKVRGVRSFGLRLAMKARSAAKATAKTNVRLLAHIKTLTNQPEASASNSAQALQVLGSELTLQGFTPLTNESRGVISESVKEGWLIKGLIAGTAELCTAWSPITRPALDQRRARGELVSIKLRGKHYYPSAFLRLSSEVVKELCLLLKGLDAVSQVMFWIAKHPELGGLTLEQAIRGLPWETVVKAVHAKGQTDF